MAKAKRGRAPSLGRAVGIIHRDVMRYMDRELAPLALGKGTFVFMATLYHNDGMRQEDLTYELGVSKSTTTRNMFQPAQRSNTAIRTRGEPRVRSRPSPVLRLSPLLTDSPPARIR